MLKRRISVILCIVALLVVISTTGVIASGTLDEIQDRGVLKVAVYLQDVPFSFVSKEGKPVGMTIDILERIADAMGVKLELVSMDWAGLIPSLLSKKVDMVAADMSITLERALVVLFTDPWFKSGEIALARTNDQRFEHWTDVDKEGIKVAVTVGTVGERLAREKLKKAEIVPYNNTIDAVTALRAGRVDAFFDDLPPAQFRVRQMGDIRILDGLIIQDDWGYAVRPEDIHLWAWLNEFLRQLRRDNEYDRLYKYWIKGNEWEELYVR